MTHPVYESLHEALHEIRLMHEKATGAERQRYGEIAVRLANATELYVEEYWQLIDEKFRAVALINLLIHWRQASETGDPVLIASALETTLALTGPRGSMHLALAEAFRVIQLQPKSVENDQSLTLIQYRICQGAL